MYDYHTHSDFSSDADATADALIHRAVAIGLDEIAITDHYDPEYADPQFAADLDFARRNRVLDEAVEKYSGSIRVVRGIEMGLQPGKANALCAAAAKDGSYDFILASVHCADGIPIDLPAYREGREPARARARYYEDLLRCVSEYNDFDALGHINVIDRYVACAEDNDDSSEIVDEILKKLIREGKGLEINTSAQRYGMGERGMPTKAVFKRYVELGGEIVTTGSDAHRAQDVGFGLAEAERMMRDAG
ncbi:MAG: histidinol-phosphatase HisJ family protein, partial [Clostridiales Family XIII bacterium]|nr:histidinol-phosphatase HisJ family protein [Clostridiales Family XIII bacterium]